MLAGAADGDPGEETLEAGAFAPEEGEEFAGVERGGFVAEEGFEAPLDIGGAPGAKAVAPGDDPVVAESVQHGKEVTSADGRIAGRMERG